MEKVDIAALLAQLEHLCQSCGGSGENDDEGDVEVCPTCDGAGYELTPDGELFAAFVERHLRHPG